MKQMYQNMREMKQNMKMLAVLLTAAVALAACSNEDLKVSAAPADPSSSITRGAAGQIHSPGDVESVELRGFKGLPFLGSHCVKLYVTETTGYYILCYAEEKDVSWEEAFNLCLITNDGLRFECGSLSDWEAIMKACDAWGFRKLNSKFADVKGWNNMSGYYWTTSESGGHEKAWGFTETRLEDERKQQPYTNEKNKGNVRLICPFPGGPKEGDVKSVCVDNYRCAKVYTSATNGYYIACENFFAFYDGWYCFGHSWKNACNRSESHFGKTFKLGTVDDYTAIMAACGGNGYGSINRKCSGVTGWKDMRGSYWTRTKKGNNQVWTLDREWGLEDWGLGSGSISRPKTYGRYEYGKEECFNYVRFIAPF